MTKNVSKSLAHALALLTTVFWGTSFIFSKVLLETYTPTQVMFFRFIIAYIALWILCPKTLKLSFREELGFVGCAAVLVILFLIIARCVWVGIRSQDTLRRLVCFGVASALIFQVIVNIGMNIGVMPVIGLTLPFISYGGSSIITLYIMLGLVSGVFAHPSATSHERYIHPPIRTYL